MNILLLNISIGKGGWGGIESHSDILASTLARKGHNVIMGCQVDGFITTEAAKLKIPARKVRVINSGDAAAIIKIIRIALKENIDLIIANHGREYWPAAIAAKFSHARIIFVRHQTDRLKSTTCLLVNRFVDRVIAVSGAVREALIKSGISPEKITLIPNSIVLARFNPDIIDKQEPRKELGIDSVSVVVGTVGKLNSGKGVYEMLNAFNLLAEKYPHLKLLFVGEGPERGDLEQEAEKLRLSGRVVFAGMRRDVERMYAAMDIFALPSTCDEAFGMVLIEAMAMEKPVIGTTVGGIPAIINNNVTGLLVPPADEISLSAAIGRYLEDKDFALKTARKGRRYVKDTFSDETSGDKFEAVFKALFSQA